MNQTNTDSFDLPVTQIWREAYGFVFSVPTRVLVAALVPFGLYFLISAAVQLTFLNTATMEFVSLSAELENMDFESTDVDMSVFGDFVGAALGFFGWLAVLMFFGGLAGASMAAGWHRTTLIGLDADRTGFGLFLGAVEFRYFFRALLMVIITVAVLFAYAIIASIIYGILLTVSAIAAPGGAEVVAIILIIPFIGLGILIGLYMWSKLIMSLPAAALGINSFGLGQAWSATRGHVGRLMKTYAGLMLPLFLVGLGVSWVLEVALNMPTDPDQISQSDLTRAVLISIIPNFVLTAFSTALVASGMSYTYYRLGQPPEWVEKVF